MKKKQISATIRAVAKEWGVTQSSITAKERGNKTESEARHVCIYLLASPVERQGGYSSYDMSPDELSKLFRKTPQLIRHAIRSVGSNMKSNRRFKERVASAGELAK